VNSFRDEKFGVEAFIERGRMTRKCNKCLNTLDDTLGKSKGFMAHLLFRCKSII